MWKTRIIAVLCILLGVGLGAYVYQSEKDGSNQFKLGLDLSGGSYLVYRADTAEVPIDEVEDSMDALRDVIERRINAFGVAEPNVSTERNTIGLESAEDRLVVELPGVTDIDEAIELIGQTPLLEFKTEASEEVQEQINLELESLAEGEVFDDEGNPLVDLNKIIALQDSRYVNTDLTGKYLQKATLQFTQAGLNTGGGIQSQPYIALSFDAEGAQLFEEITSENIGKTIAIYLDGQLVSAPVVNAAIPGGQAIIQGGFTVDEAKTTVGRLNSGALPIAIELISTNTIGPTLGQDAIDAGVRAGILGLALVALILILWYRLPGLIAVIALGIYTAIMLWMFKFIPVTLTSAGITGFIISIGIAVDANILIFERMKEEIRSGKNLYDAVSIGFTRAWASIRDANISSIIMAVILFMTKIALIQGFALTFGLGILVSMFTAVTITRYMLLALTKKEGSSSNIMRFLYQNGLSK